MSSSIHYVNDGAVSAGFDKDIIHVAMVSSSPAASIAETNDSNTAAGSVSSDEDITGATVVPYAGPVGSAYTADTPPEDVPDWCVYLSLCEDGPTVCIQCVDTINDDGTPGQFNKMKISKKLLCDYSKYFKAMFKHQFTEGSKGAVQFVDILQEEMVRLKMFLISGAPSGRISIGKLEEEMSNLVRTYELADRFNMPEILQRITKHATDLIVFHNNWRASYQHEVLDAPAVSTTTTAKETFHREKLLDFCKAHDLLSKLPAHARVIHPDQLITLIAERCHPKLLRSMTRHMDKDLKSAVFDAMLTKLCV